MGVPLKEMVAVLPEQMEVVPLMLAVGRGKMLIRAVPVTAALHDGVPAVETLTKE